VAAQDNPHIHKLKDPFLIVCIEKAESGGRAVFYGYVRPVSAFGPAGLLMRYMFYEESGAFIGFSR